MRVRNLCHEIIAWYSHGVTGYVQRRVSIQQVVAKFVSQLLRAGYVGYYAAVPDTSRGINRRICHRYGFVLRLGHLLNEKDIVVGLGVHMTEEVGFDVGITKWHAPGQVEGQIKPP